MESREHPAGAKLQIDGYSDIRIEGGARFHGPKGLSPKDKASLTRIEGFAKEVLRQCEFLRRNGSGDEMRLGWIYLKAVDLQVEVRKAWRRYCHRLAP